MKQVETNGWFVSTCFLGLYCINMNGARIFSGHHRALVGYKWKAIKSMDIEDILTNMIWCIFEKRCNQSYSCFYYRDDSFFVNPCRLSFGRLTLRLIYWTINLPVDWCLRVFFLFFWKPIGKLRELYIIWFIEGINKYTYCK